MATLMKDISRCGSHDLGAPVDKRATAGSAARHKKKNLVWLL